MRDPQFVKFLETWHQIMIILVLASLVTGILIYVYFRLKSSTFRQPKAKYDYLKKNEIRFYWYTTMCVAFAIAFLANTYDDRTVALSIVWFFVRFFISGAVATLFGYIIYLVLVYYYPSKLQKKLTRLRYLPRVSKAGNEMQLLSEEEEDVHLDEGMQAEENVFSVDYDVWVDTETGEVRIEKYPGELEALKCNTCGFQTMQLTKEEIIKEATKEEEGELLKYYVCAYCKSKRTTSHTIAPIIDSLDQFKLPENVSFVGERKVKSIMIQIVDTKGDMREFFFQNTNQAKKFLEEFDFDKLPVED